MNFTAAGANREVAANVADVDSAAARLNTDCATDIIQMYCSAGTLSIQPSGNSSSHDRAALGLDLDRIQVMRNGNGDVGRKLMRTTIVPVADDPGSVPFDVIADLVGLQHSASAIFRGLERLVAHDIRD